ncbi:MAG: long-chain fatty acid--CoA ligase [Candidatus Nitronauta litoralis]|uniref:Long-chain fatty acid--CoA ligase n=1 Tax=Candidatus Nitronauta litoralis TaxID=2705533 RepID=A0A7T0G0T8_9BACT|nr:MAG: long-chain fatty acid--CoA ligase [Candidatus Nitronauta litoralis]
MALEFYKELQEHAQNQPDHPAIIETQETITYKQLLDRVERFAGGLDALDPGPESKLAIMGLNQSETLISMLGAFLKGVPVVPYNYLLTPDDLVYITQDAGVDLMMVNPAFIKDETSPFFKSFRHRILTGPEQGHDFPKEATHSFTTFVEQGDREKGKVRISRPDQVPDMILYTSGTTARPKGVGLNESQFYDNTSGVREHLPFTPEDRAIMALPLFHSFGNIIALVFLRAGGTLILIPQFQPKSILQGITEHKATVLPLVPTIYSFLVQLYQRGEYDATSLNYCISGGAALPHALLHQVEKTLGCTVLEGYGLTETSPVIAVNTMQHGSVVGSVGPVLPNVDVKIVDDQGKEVTQGEVGEILCKAPTVMQGYWKKPEETKEVLTEDGWLKTGDLGHLDEQGRLYISAGRKKDLIIRAGENISPLAIENVLMNHPAVAEVAAIGVPHERMGEQVKVCLVLREGAEATIQDLRNYCREKMPAFMTPDSFELYEALPKTPTGKVLKTQLRGEAANT